MDYVQNTTFHFTMQTMILTQHQTIQFCIYSLPFSFIISFLVTATAPNLNDFLKQREGGSVPVTQITKLIQGNFKTSQFNEI